MRLSFPKIAQKKLAEIALDSTLFIPYWSMVEEYVHIKNHPNTTSKIIVAFNGNEPIAAAIYLKDTHKIAIFVKSSFRKQGIGSLMIQKTLQRFNLNHDDVCAGDGVHGSEIFFKKNKLLVYPYAEVPISYDDDTNKQSQQIKEFLKKEYQQKFGNLQNKIDTQHQFENEDALETA